MKIGSIELRTAQINLINKLDEAIEKGINKAYFVFPTGLGKSYGSFAHALRFIKDYEKKKKGRILILVHTEDLIKQHRKDFLRLCKSKSIGILYKAQKDIKQDVIIANVRTFKTI